MLKAKDTNFLSEISSFFKNNDASKAMNNMMYMISSLNMIEHTLFGRSTRFNSKYSLLQILTCLILFPCFIIRNPYSLSNTRLGGIIGCGKDVFYRFARDSRTDWRRILYQITLQLWNKIRVRSDHKKRTTCLIVDDTDFGKTGKKFELMGRVFSHVHHKSILGFKALTHPNGKCVHHLLFHGCPLHRNSLLLRQQPDIISIFGGPANKGAGYYD